MSAELFVSRVLIVAPQTKELSALCVGFSELGYSCEPEQVGRLGCQSIPPLGFILAVGGHGKTQFAVQTQHLLDNMAPIQVVMCVGAAGGLSPDLTVGDVVVATASVEHDYRLRFTPSPPPRHEAHRPTIRCLQDLATTEEFTFGVHFGAIASGDEDIVSTDRAAELHSATGALCVAWEGSGGARAADFAGVPFVEIRVVTDHADNNAPSVYREALGRVLPNASKFLAAWRKTGAGAT
jgi:adenosylhomocysteine nucleosidase